MYVWPGRARNTQQQSASHFQSEVTLTTQILEWAFGKRMTPAERLRKNQRMLDKAIRELDQTRVKLEKQEKTLVQQIKTSAKNGQMGACKIQAKDLVRTRRYVEKFFAMRSQLQKISLRLQVRFYARLPTSPAKRYRPIERTNR